MVTSWQSPFSLALDTIAGNGKLQPKEITNRLILVRLQEVGYRKTWLQK
jgi:hypothetical protein